MDSLMSGEDFSLYMEKVPGFFGFVGAYNEAKGLVHSNHHEKFTADEDALERGSALTAQFAADYLWGEQPLANNPVNVVLYNDGRKKEEE